jgi:hypothetical protein
MNNPILNHLNLKKLEKMTQNHQEKKILAIGQTKNMRNTLNS